MFTVEMRLDSVDLPSHMGDMRVWLDSNNVETAGFSYVKALRRATSRVDFSIKRDAEAFALRFGGQLHADAVD